MMSFLDYGSILVYSQEEKIKVIEGNIHSDEPGWRD